MPSRNRPPGPKGALPGLPFLSFARDPLGFLSRVAREHGDVVYFGGVSQDFYLLNHPDHVRDVLVTHNARLMKGRGLQRAKRLLGEGLLTSEPPLHRRQRRLRLMMPFAEFLGRLPLPANRRFKESRARLDRVIYRIIEERRASGEDRGDLLSMLLKAQDDEGDGAGMTDEQLRDEVVTIFLAGHETTANALAWTWFLLSQNPEAEARLHQDIEPQPVVTLRPRHGVLMTPERRGVVLSSGAEERV